MFVEPSAAQSSVGRLAGTHAGAGSPSRANGQTNRDSAAPRCDDGEPMMLPKYYSGTGVSKASLSRRFGMSPQAHHEWASTWQFDRDLTAINSEDTPHTR